MAFEGRPAISTGKVTLKILAIAISPEVHQQPLPFTQPIPTLSGYVLTLDCRFLSLGISVLVGIAQTVGHMTRAVWQLQFYSFFLCQMILIPCDSSMKSGQPEQWLSSITKPK